MREARLLQTLTPFRPGPPLAAPDAAPGYRVAWARHQDEVAEAQRLRHAVFAGEMGARMQSPEGSPDGHDIDRFDRHCEHLLVRAADSGPQQGQVIGTYRVLTPAAARRAGGLYTETEFDLSALAPLRPRALELGRSCVHPAWRHGGVILALWSALGRYLVRHRLETVIGCASIGLGDGGRAARSLWRQFERSHLAAPAFRVKPRIALPLAAADDDGPAIVPALIKGYLRCGAKVLGPPALDADFRTADLPMLMQLHDMPARHRQRLLDH